MENIYTSLIKLGGGGGGDLGGNFFEKSKHTFTIRYMRI